MTDHETGAASHHEPDAPAATTTGAGGTPPGLVLAWRAPLLAYAAALAVSLVLGVLLLVAGTTGSTPDDVGDVGDATEGVLAWLAVPVQLAALALGGRVGLDTEGFSVSVSVLPLLVTATYLVALVRLAGAAEGRIPARSRADRALTSAAGAGVAAVVVAVVTRVLALRADDASIHALSVSLVFGTLLLTFAGDLVGRELRAVGVPAAVRRWSPLAVAWLAHVGIWLTVSLPVLFVAAWVREGFGTALTVPVWWPTVGLWTYVLGHLSAIGTLGSYAWMWSDGGVLAPLVLFLGAVVATTFAALVWHLRGRRTATELATPASWAHLPAAFVVGGIVVTLLSIVSIGGGAFGVGGSFTIMPAAWTCIVLGLWGLAAEWLSRAVAPRIADALPPGVVDRLRGPAPVDADSDVAAEDAPARKPLSVEEARRIRRIAIIGGGAVGVLLIGAIAVSIIGSTFYTPERAAQDYVDAIADGDVEAVADALPDSDDVSTDLLTAAVLEGATDRPTSYTVGDVSTLGGDAMVEVTADDGVGGESYLTLEKGEKKFGLFQEWDVTEGLSSTLTISADGTDEISVNGVTIDAPAEGYGSYAVLPGTYAVDPFAGNPWLEAASTEVEVPLGEIASPDTASPAPSAAFTEQVEDAVGAWLDECMASTEPDPEGCPQSAYAFGDVRDLTWELTKAPSVDYDFFSPDFPMSLYVTGGSATATYEVDESYGFGAPEWVEESDESSLDFSVEVEADGDELVVTPEAY